MSTKTLRKRIALVAVSALGAGLLSVVAVPSANAAGGVAASTLYISATAGTSGEGSANAAMASASSSGFVAKTSTNGTSASGGYTLTGAIGGTAVALAGAQIAFNAGGSAVAADGVSVVVTGGTMVSLAAAANDGTTMTSITPSVNGASTVAVAVAAGTSSAQLIGRFKISAAAGTTATLTAYTGSDIDGTTTATNGTMIGTWTFTVASASTTGVYDAASSQINTQVSFTKSTTASGTLAYDSTSRINNGLAGSVYWSLKDAFLSPITSGTIAVTATNSATVGIATAPAAGAAYAATTSFASMAVPGDGAGYIVVNQPVANTAGSTTLTLTLDGAVIGTKTLNWSGDAASITFDAENSVGSFINGQDEDTVNQQSGVVYVIKDAAGNALNWSALPTLSSGTGSLIGASLGATVNTTSGVLQTSAYGYGTATMIVPASTLNGAGTYKLKIVNGAGAAIYTPAISATVSNGGLNSFAATWDKTSYTPGEIAVLTVTGKDVYGNAIADGTAAAGLSLTVAGSSTAGFFSVGTACSTSTVFSGGKFTCKFAANTEGAWSYSVDVTTATAQSATVGSLKITSGGGVSNADVLKAIVSLIASINKQIAALQKALLKK
jgi:hypothetical protein